MVYAEENHKVTESNVNLPFAVAEQLLLQRSIRISHPGTWTV